MPGMRSRPKNGMSLSIRWDPCLAEMKRRGTTSELPVIRFSTTFPQVENAARALNWLLRAGSRIFLLRRKSSVEI